MVGAGDALVAGCVAALSAGRSAEEAVAIGVAAARRAVESDENVGAGGGGTGTEALEADAREVTRGERGDRDGDQRRVVSGGWETRRGGERADGGGGRARGRRRG